MTKFDPHQPLFQPRVEKEFDPNTCSLDPPPTKNLNPHLHFDNSITGGEPRNFICLAAVSCGIYQIRRGICQIFPRQTVGPSAYPIIHHISHAAATGKFPCRPITLGYTRSPCGLYTSLQASRTIHSESLSSVGYLPYLKIF